MDHLTSAGAHIDVLIHNAGVIENDPNRYLNESESIERYCPP